MRGVVSEALASGKVVYREVCTEGSQTAKSGTDGQKRYMRLFNVGKQAHHCNVQRTPKTFCSRYRRDWTKENALTRGGLELYVLLFEKSAEAIVGGVWYELIGGPVEVERTDRPSYPTTEVTSEGLNIKQLPCCMDPPTGGSHQQMQQG